MRLLDWSFPVFAAFLTLTPGHLVAAEPVEVAVSDWISKINLAPDWSARFTDLSYDQATDTAILSGLTINYTVAALSLTFEPVSIVGYSETGKNTFGANSISIDSVTVSAAGFDGVLADLRLDGLGNFAKDLGHDSVWDKQRPFTSLMRVYARLVDITLEHGAIGSFSMVVKDQADEITASYDNIAIDGWADGKVASATTGSLKVASSRSSGPFTLTIDSTESRGVDYAAMMRIYDPDQYVGGVGDLVWRLAVEFVGYNGLVLRAPDAELTIGSASLENFRVRQPERSFNQFLDRAMANPDANTAPTTDELRAVLGYFSAFAIGSISMQQLGVEGADGGSGHLSNLSVTDISAEGLAEFSINDLTGEKTGEGHVEIGRIAFGGVTFPPLEALIDAAEAEQSGADFDYAKLTTQIGFFETRAIDVDVLNNPPFRLDRARLDLGNYIGSVPTSLSLDIAGADLPASAINDPTIRAMFQSLGYDRVHSDFTAQLKWEERGQSVTIDRFRFSIRDLGSLSLSLVLGGLSREAIERLESLPAAMANLNFVRGAVTLEDYVILDRWVDQRATASGTDPDAVRQQMAVLLSSLTTSIGNSSFQEQLRRVLEAAVIQPGPITATAMPQAPIPLTSLALMAQAAPMGLPNLLGLTIESVAPTGR